MALTPRLQRRSAEQAYRLKSRNKVKDRRRSGMAEMAEEPSSGGEQELEALSVDDFKKLLKLLRVRLPKEVLTPEAVARSTHPNVIADATRIKQDLENCRLKIAPIPRLACGNIKQVLEQRENKEFLEITKTILFRDSKGDTLRKQWERNARDGGGFRIKDTYKETDSLHRKHRNASRWNYSENQKVARSCFQFYLQQMGLAPGNVNLKKPGKLEFGFLSGKPNFLVEMKGSPEDASPSEKLIVKCNSTINTTENIFTRPKKGSQVEFKPSHQYYLHTQGFLFIQRERERLEENPLPVRAVMVMKAGGYFYWGEVSEDTEKIRQLNDCCKDEALPRFLAVLSLIFEKTPLDMI
ncbi:hypothetical protein QTP86_001544 [Hemibagrus guttatus]|nr:hypothetical protein QTP86_001544 [Hemibagrus guttatus]